MIRTPESTNLVPMTFADAATLYRENGQKPFSFVAAPYGILKTTSNWGGKLVAVDPSAVGPRMEGK